MNVGGLDELFEIEQYWPDKSGRATVELVNGVIRIRIPYHFLSVAGASSPTVMVDAEATEAQLNGIKQVLAQILQATNQAIETEHGWTKYVEPVIPELP